MRRLAIPGDGEKPGGIAGARTSIRGRLGRIEFDENGMSPDVLLNGVVDDGTVDPMP